jgi:hypothetical protein
LRIGARNYSTHPTGQQACRQPANFIVAGQADLLPWSETWLEELPDDQPRCRDPQDQIFLDLAIGAGVQALVSGDKDLLVFAATISNPRILEPEMFRNWLNQESTGAAQGGQDPLVT